MSFPGFENIFSLGEPFATRPFRGSLREAPRELDYFSLAWGRVVPSEPVRIVPYGGRHPGDFIWTDAVVIRLVSRRILALLRDSQITGWSVFPVEVCGRDGELIREFDGFSVTGRCGHIDPARSTPILKKMPGGVFPYSRGYYFKPESWDGSHIFSPEGTAHIFVTRVVLDLLRRSNAKNIEYSPITEIEFGEVEKAVMQRMLARQ